MTQQRRWRSATALSSLAAALLAAAPATAAPWEVIVNPYFMLPTSDGKFGVGAYETNSSSSPSDVFSKLNWGVMGAVELNNGNWGFVLDVNYLNLDVTDDGVRRVSVNGHQAAYTATILKRVHKYAEIYGGWKISDMGLDLDCGAGCPVPLSFGGGTFTGKAKRQKTWTEPVLGFRADLPFNDKLGLVVAADVGGFSVGSDISANFWPQLAWRFGERSRAMLGYRVIYVKYDEGEGRERFLYDAVTQGPTLGVEFRF